MTETWVERVLDKQQVEELRESLVKKEMKIRNRLYTLEQQKIGLNTELAKVQMRRRSLEFR